MVRKSWDEMHEECPHAFAGKSLCCLMLRIRRGVSERCITTAALRPSDMSRSQPGRRSPPQLQLRDRTRHPLHPWHVTSTTARITLGTALDRIDVGAFTVTRSTYEPGQMLPSHIHADACATIVMRGSVSERVGSRRFECHREQFLVRPAKVVHENVYGPVGAECMLVSARAEWVESDQAASALFRSPGSARAPATLSVARRIGRELRLGDRAAALAIEGLTLELMAVAARRLDDRQYRAVPAWLHSVRERLHDDCSSDLRLYVIAREVGVHPVHLTRAFRQHFACSPGEYVRQRRIDSACAELADSDRSISEIALDAGFSSPSHFATAFRRSTGVTPSDYRAAAQRMFRS